jgi:hypothetical protein
MKQKAVLVILVSALLAFALISCQKDVEILPSCGWIESTYDGEKLKLVIHSESLSVMICRDFDTRTQCMKVGSSFYGCISMSADLGEVLRVMDDKTQCKIMVE